jgi:RES domain-containing protein
LITRIPSADLPRGWSSPEPVAATQAFGDRWILEGRSAVLEVPSAITNEETNFLVNPRHTDFNLIEVGEPLPFRIDPRLA